MNLCPAKLESSVIKRSKMDLLVNNKQRHALSVQFSHSVVSNSLRPYGLQHARPPCHHQLLVFTQTHVHRVSDAISSSVVHFLSCPQSFPASGSFQISQFFTSGGQTIGASASVSGLPMSIKGWFSLGWTGWISLQSKGFSRVFSNTTVKSINSLALSFLYSPTITFVHDYWKTIDLIRQTFVGK